MNLNFSILRTLYGNELRMVLRDRRTIVTAIVLPLVVMPLILFGSSWTQKKRERALATATYRFAVTGSEAPRVRSLVAATQERLLLATTNAQKHTFHFEEKSVTNALRELNLGQIHFFVEGLTPDEARLEESKQGNVDSSKGNSRSASPNTPVVRLVFRGDRDDSMAGVGRMESALRQTARNSRFALLKDRGFPVAPEHVAAIAPIDVASKGHASGLLIGKVLTLFLLMFVFSGGEMVANDLIAGEKERGTLETLLTTGAGRAEIIFAKHLVTVTIAIFITLLQIANLLVYVGLHLIPASANFAAAVPPGVAVLLFFLFLPVAALVSGVLLLVSAFAKSYKEAQLYFLPVLLVGMVPALAPLFPDLPLRSAVVLVPIANIALAAKGILVGSLDWPMITIAWLSTAAAAAVATRMSASYLSQERLVTTAGDRAEFEGGPLLFSRRVLRWFAVLWATLWIVSSYIGTADIRAQIFVNLVVLFFGASVFMLWKYQLDPRIALALRKPKPAVWLAIACAIPGGILTASGVSQLANFFIPIRSETMEEFTRTLLPDNISIGQLIFFLALMPALFEEITFRGMLLYGLHQRLRPVPLAVAVGLIFAVFHFALFRFAGTAVLGAFFTATTLLTGSIFPAMLWHAGNNAISVLAEVSGVPLSDLNPECYGIGLGFLAVAFWILWRNRTPYPGLLSRRSSSGL